MATPTYDLQKSKRTPFQWKAKLDLKIFLVVILVLEKIIHMCISSFCPLLKVIFFFHWFGQILDIFPAATMRLMITRKWISKPDHVPHQQQQHQKHHYQQCAADYSQIAYKPLKSNYK
ncbi:unnamed protein product [Ceratitis capitata]|uniref:(Mediterranean fruit fly) hypothetical protein n=1 Tax=Ceratitis capitata TaxID=7213 RepID=A0A811V9F0_CERCA|nr:unnamed protein product [Ceratitis capitata]